MKPPYIQSPQEKQRQLLAEQAAQKDEQRRRKVARIHALKRKALHIAAAQTALALSHVLRNQ